MSLRVAAPFTCRRKLSFLTPPFRAKKVIRSLRFEMPGFFLKMVESNAALVWDGFAFTLRGRLVGWIYLYISYQSVLA